MELTDKQLHTLRHSLGLERSGKPYRNYFAAGENDEECKALTEAGLMECMGSPSWTTLTYYRVTADGMRAIGVDPNDVE